MYSFISINPQPALQPFVEQFILYEVNSKTPVVQNFVPSNFQNICFVLKGRIQLLSTGGKLPVLRSYVLGQTSQPHTVKYRGHIKILAIHFKPTGMYQLFGIPMNSFTNLGINFEIVAGTDGKYFVERIFGASTLEVQVRMMEEYLLQKMQRKTGFPAKQIEYAGELIQHRNGNIQLKYLLNEVNMCERNFERRFIETIGVSPKTFAGIARINKALQMIESKFTWKGIADQLNYTDQAHFNNDFKKFTGKTPTQYYNSKANLEHFLYGG